MRFTTVLESQGAGRAVAAEAVRRGHVHDDIAPDVGYVRLCTFEPWRRSGLMRLATLRNQRVPTIPRYEDSLLYDDKAAQVPVLEGWLPDTWLIDDPAAAPTMALPFVSKAACGAASQNVRFVQTQEAAEREIELAFRGDGIPLTAGTRRAPKAITRQRGYLIWQEFVVGNAHDYRVVVNGDRLYGLTRGNRDDVPFASGSGRTRPITDLGEGRARAAFTFARAIAEALDLRWGCFDVVFRGDEPRVLEMSFSWVEGAYSACPCFERTTLERDGTTAAAWATFAVDEMERML